MTISHADCSHLPDFAGETCAGCGEEIDRYGNTANDFNSCCFPDCGCDGARLCMAGKASELAGKYNGEGMHHTPDPAARMAFAGAFYDGEFDAAQGTEAGTAETEGLGPKDDGPVAEGDAPNLSPNPNNQMAGGRVK